MKQLCKSGLMLALLMTLVALVAAVPVFALEPYEGARTSVVEPRDGVSTNSNQPFLNLDTEDDDVVRIKLGRGLLYLGNDVVNSASTDGLLFSFGNRMSVRGVGEYGIAAANILEISGVVEKDLFAAGNLVHVTQDAEIGRDVYLAGNDVTLGSDISGNVAVAASKISFANTTISGDVNLSTGQIIFGQNVAILGTLVYNEDAQVSGIDNISVAHIQTYAATKAEPSASELWMSQAIEVIGTIITALVLIVVFPKLKDRIVAETNAQRFGMNFLNGLGFLVLLPVLSILLMISVFGMKAGLLLLAAWFIVVCITGVFTGMWLGHLIVEKLFRSNAPFMVEAAVGIIVLGCLALIPGIDAATSFFSVVFGTGLLVSCVRPPKAKEMQPTSDPAKTLENPFRGQGQKHAAKSSTKKPASKTAANSAKSTNPTRKPSKKK